MRTIINGIVNNIAFSLKEDGKAVCRESKYCKLISDSAQVSLNKTKQKLKKGLYPTAVLDIAGELENLKDVNIQVSKAIEYKKELTIVYYLHVPKNKNCSKKLFIKGKFKDGKTFKVLENLSTQVWDKNGQLNKSYSHFVHAMLSGLAFEFNGPQIQNTHCIIFQKLQNIIPELIAEQVYFYLRVINPNVKY